MINLYTGILAGVFFILFLIVFSKNNRGKKLFIKIVIVLFAILAFLFDPIKAYEENGHYTDLYRFFYDMQSFSEYGWDCPDEYLKSDYSAIIFAKIIVYIVGKVGVYNLLAAISAIIVYGITFWVFLDFVKIKKIDIKYAFLAFFIFVSLYNYSIIITNIRMPIAMSLFFLILYMDFIKQKDIRLCLVGYTLLLFVHTAFILFLIIRIVALITNNKTYRFVAIIFLTYGFFIEFIGDLILLYQDNVYFKELWDKFYLYFYTSKVNDFNFFIMFLRNHKNYMYVAFAK